MQRRLENIDQVQWEIDAWMRHYVQQAIRDPNARVDSKVATLNKVGQILFREFGQPDVNEVLK